MAAVTRQQAAIVQATFDSCWDMLDQIDAELRFAVVGMMVVNAFAGGVKTGHELELFEEFVTHQRGEIEHQIKEEHRGHKL